MKKRVTVFFIIYSLIFFTTPAFAQVDNSQAELIFKNHSPAMLMVNVNTGKIMDVNQTAIAFYGYSKDELLNLNILQLSNLSAKEIQKESKAALLQKSDYFVSSHKLKNGKIREVEIYSYPFTDENGEQVLFLTMHDITSRINVEQQEMQSKWIFISLLATIILLLTLYLVMIKKTKNQLMKSNIEMKSLFDNMQEGFALHEIICDHDGKPIDYRFIDVNSSFERITSLKMNKIRNKTIKEVLPNTENYWIEKYGEVALKGVSTYFSNYSKELNKYFSVSVYSPKIGQFVTVFTDITAQVLTNNALAVEKRLLETIVEDALSGYWDWDIVNDIQYLSASFKRMFGYKDNELENCSESWKRIIFKEDLPKVLDKFNEHIASNGRVPFYDEIRCCHKNGSTMWVISTGRVIEWDNHQKPLRMVGCHIDITRNKELEQVLREEKALFKTILYSLGDGVISADKQGKVDIMNVVAEELTGWSSADAKGKDFDEVFKIINEFTEEISISPVKKVFELGETTELDEYTLLIKKNGKRLPIEHSAAPITDEKGEIIGAVVVLRDYTEKKEKQEEIAYLSYHDQLTGLYNRRFFEEELKRLDTQRNLPFTIAMIDVNGLKLINDAFGHLIGDELLKKVAMILRNECRRDDIISRIGGDEFVILLPNTTKEKTKNIVKRIYEATESEQMENIVISASIGWETKVSDDQLMKDIFIKAEEHMYRNKLTESQSMRNKTVQIILETLYKNNTREQMHSEKVSMLSKRIAMEMNFSDNEIKEIEISGLMHDIGKIIVNENLLTKPGLLTEAEYDNIKKHSESGYQILKAVNIYSSLAQYVLSHHERWDGSGYPRGLKGNEIPIISRIITVADAYDAMISERPYKDALSKDLAIEELRKYSGTQFDPEIITIFTEKVLKSLD